MCDRFAKQIASEVFPKVRIKQIPNYYHKAIQKEINLQSKPICQDNYLYICEPYAQTAQNLYGNADYFQTNELVLLRKFLGYMLAKYPMKNIKVRLHPSEKFNKYSAVINAYPELRIDISYHTDLIQDILWAEKVIGGSSMALVVGLLAKKKVYSCLPPESKINRLPYKRITKLNLWT